MSKRFRALLAILVLLLAACSSGDDGADAGDRAAAATEEPVEGPGEAGGEEPGSEGAEEESEEARTLRILVSNDDGYDAEGIDVLVEGLLTLDDVDLVVYAPEDQQSGTGGRMTNGLVDVRDAELLSGHPVRAVDGFPSDSVRMAMDEEGVEVDLVVTGINEGQNLGWIMDLSGTVGAARAAVTRGVPALATSQGFGELTYHDAIPFILEWIEDRRETLLDGTEPVEVTNLNVPSCSTGELRGLLEAEPADEDAAEDAGGPFGEVDCESEVSEDELINDVAGFNNGFAVIGPVPAEPEVPAELVEPAA